VLFELLTGRPPFDVEEPHELLVRHLSAVPPTLHEACPEVTFPQGLEDAVRTALAKAREDRFADANAFGAALAALAPSLQATVVPVAAARGCSACSRVRSCSRAC
jgi:hypothetical protein